MWGPDPNKLSDRLTFESTFTVDLLLSEKSTGVSNFDLYEALLIEKGPG